MKTNRIITLEAALATSFVALSLTGEQMGHRPGATSGAEPSKAKAMEGMAQKASDIIGMDVADSRGHEVGTVKDLLVDFHNGGIAEVIIGSSIFARPAEKVTPLPPACLTFSPSGKTLRMNIALEEMKNAPTFEMSRWREAAGAKQAAEVYQHYGVPAPKFGTLTRVRLVLGRFVRNDRDQKLGRVINMVVDVPTGRVDKVIVSSDGFLGIRSELTAVTPQSFVYNQDRNQISLHTTPEGLKAALHFKAADWRTSAAQAEPATGAATVGALPAAVSVANSSTPGGQGELDPARP